MGLFRKFWPDCPYRLCLITDRLSASWSGDAAVEVGSDLGWGANLMVGMAKLGYPRHVLLMQEDFFLSAPVKTDEIKRALSIMLESGNNACFRLYPCPGPDVPLDRGYGLIGHNAAYRVSCQAAIWHRPELEVLAHDARTAAEFELVGTPRSTKRCGCLRYFSVLRDPDPSNWPMHYYCSAISRGEWEPDAVAFARAQGVPVDTGRRPVRGCPR